MSAEKTYLLDLRGIICPINFVKTKLKLEELAVGELLEVLLDEGEPIRNVPRSAQEEGHNILKVERVGSHFKVLIKKGA